MSDSIGIGAAAIRAGETRYQASVVQLLKTGQAEFKNAAPNTIPAETTNGVAAKADASVLKMKDDSMGGNVDVTV